MPVSLARRIKRIGLLLSTKDEKGNRVHNFDPAVDEGCKVALAFLYQSEAKTARLAAKAAQPTAAPNRRTKSRRKAGVK